jgi:MinD-like ATPase involved in chromosome partitioning or flagellar assembly
VTPEPAVLDNADDFLIMASRLGLLAKVRLVVNRCDRTADRDRVADRLDVPVLATIRGAGRLVVEAANLGRALVLANPRSSIADEIRTLADRVVESALTPSAV